MYLNVLVFKIISLCFLLRTLKDIVALIVAIIGIEISTASIGGYIESKTWEIIDEVRGL